MQSKSRISIKSGSQNEREQHHGYASGNPQQHHGAMGRGGQHNQMYQTSSPQNDMARQHMTGKHFQSQTGVKQSQHQGQGSKGGGHVTGANNMGAGGNAVAQGSMSHQTYNQQRIFQGGIQMSAATAHSKNSSQKRSKMQHPSQNASSGSGRQQQQIQVVSGNQYLAAQYNAGNQRQGNHQQQQAMYQTSQHMQSATNKQLKANNYNTEKQQMHGGKHSGGGMMQQHTSPPPMGQYLHKMSSTEETQPSQSQLAGGSLKSNMIQPPHIIKMKSKTNNPTRKSSPGIDLRSVIQNMNPGEQKSGVVRQSMGSQARRIDAEGTSSNGNFELSANDTPVKKSFQGGNTIQNLTKAQMLSYQNSPKLADSQMLYKSGVNQMYANSMVEHNDGNRKQTLKINLMNNEKMSLNNSPSLGKNAMGLIDMDPQSQLSASGTSHSLYQKNQKGNNLGAGSNNSILKQSLDQKLLNNLMMNSKIIKGQSSKNILYQGKEQTQTQSSIQIYQRQHSSGLNGSNIQGNKMNERGSIISSNSPGAGVVTKIGQQRVDSSSGHGGGASSTTPMGGLASHHSTQQSIKAPQKSSLDQQAQQQKKYLNMVVQKKIGGIASGKQRRENRNQLMKHSQQQVFTDNKSAVGSIGSIGSLGPFMGVQEFGSQGHGTETYDASLNSQGQNMMMKFPVDATKVNKTNGDQKFQQYQKYSQLQQMHLNNVNPMSFSITEYHVGSQSKSGKNQQQLANYNEEKFGTEQHMKTVGHPMSTNMHSFVTNQIDQSCNKSAKSGPKQNDQNYRSQTNPNLENQSMTGSGHGPLHTQTNAKSSVIQMRKVNPVSKTAQTASKNTSIDMKKTSSSGMQMHNRIAGSSGTVHSQTGNSTRKHHGNNSGQASFNQMRHQGYSQVQQPKILTGNHHEQGVYSKTSNLKYVSTKGKVYSNTTKVSLNNTPKGTKKLIGQGFQTNSQIASTAGRGPNSIHAGHHGSSQITNSNQKPQQQLRQQPIGQPMGDIPIKHDKNDPQKLKINEFNVEGSLGLDQQQKQSMNALKKHQFAQSVLLDDQQLDSQRQNSGKHPFSKSIIQQVPSPQVNMGQGGQDFTSTMKQSMMQMQQSKSSMGGTSTHLASTKSGQLVYGKVKLKVVSENSSPPAELGGLLNPQGSSFNQSQNLNAHTMNSTNYQKLVGKTKNTSVAGGSNSGSIGKGNQINYTSIHNIRQGKKMHKHSVQNSEAQSKMSATGGATLMGGVLGLLNSPQNVPGSQANRKSLNNEPNNLRRSSAAPSSSSNTLKNSTRAASNTGVVSADPAKKSFQTNKHQSSKNQNEFGQSYINQYFKQKKNIVGQVVQGGHESSQTTGHQRSIGPTNQQVFAFAKLSHLDSPKDSSIERARQNDMLLQEASGRDQAVMKMNQQLKRVVNVDLMDQPQQEEDDTGNKPTERNSDTTVNLNQQYILKNIEMNQKNPAALSPRSKEVYLIRQLIMDCFRKYNKPPKTQLELYKIGKMLGKGAFGKVNLGLHRLTRKLCAIKSINMDFMKEESQKKKIMNEINILKSLRHPNNIKILETFQTDKHHMIVMELCPGGDLLNYVRKRRKLSEKYAKFVFKQIMEGIAYLHENKVSHRDIKLDNILLDGHGNIKIGDFGVSRKIEEQEILFEQCGTPAYIAPEIVKDMGYKGFPVDIWSAGICLYAMLYGNVPFKANQIGDLNTVEQLNQDIEYKDTVSKEAIEVMKMMLQKVPKLRATAQEVLVHPWLNDDIDDHIDIFDEQELELIRKEFTYVLQKKKLKDFKEQKEKLKQRAIESQNESGELPAHQASRRPDDLNTEFTECSLQTHENSLMKNDSSRSVILCPFNTQTGDKTADKIIQMASGLMEDKDVMIRFHPRVRELDRNYEKLNNQDFDNGVYHKYAYKQKGKAEGGKEGEKDTQGKKEDGLKEETIKQSDVQVNNLVSTKEQRQAASQETGVTAGAENARKRRREKADINYHNYYIKINQDVISDTARLGFPRHYIEKCLRENANNHCTTTYYLLCMDQNF